MTEFLSIKEFRKLRSQGKVRGTKKNKSSGIETITRILRDNGVSFKREFPFSKTRKFRFDFIIGTYNDDRFHPVDVAIEYEGAVSAKSRHTTLTGYTRDCTKYNLAMSEGYKVYRYTALNLNELSADIVLIKKNSLML